MKKFSRAISMILAVVMVLMTFPATVFAASTDDMFEISGTKLVKFNYEGENLHIAVPEGITEIGRRAFEHHKGLVSVYLPDGVTKIDEAAFIGTTNLTQIRIPESLEEIRVAAFQQSGISSIYLPDTMTNIEWAAFCDCDNLASITFPSGITEIKDNTFYGADGLTTVIIPDNITRVNKLAFGNCKKLSEVTIGKNVGYIDSSAFELSPIVTFNIDPENVRYYLVDGVMFDALSGYVVDGEFVSANGYLVHYPVGSDATHYTIPDGTPGIGGYAFAMHWIYTGDPALSSVTIPESVKEIRPNAFAGSSGQLRTIYGTPGSAAEEFFKNSWATFNTGTIDNPIYSNAPNLGTADGWALLDIDNAVHRGYVPESIQNNYTNNITRKEFTILLVNFMAHKGSKDIDTVLWENGASRYDVSFTDTDDPDILAACALGIVGGTGDGKFSPDNLVTREQAAVMIMKTIEVLGQNTREGFYEIIIDESISFDDSDSISDWATDAVKYVVTAGHMSGTGGNKFSPQGNFTRQESIVTLNRIKY